ncbi:MAG: prolipoprotein diacylglyceryl transferase [Alphaproteobacteria bacterium]|nr:prolipoprotein diacylglyceryl transferase [Alphaproteobacteria bacterium]
MSFPNIDPVAITLGSIAIRWYSLAYIFGLLAGYWYINQLIKRPPPVLTQNQLSKFFSWVIVAVICGGRLGYVIFYQGSYYIEHPIKVFYLWEGGMSFHGGIIGVIIAVWVFSRQHKVKLLGLSDLLACAAPIGIFFGRLANFINGELYGRVSEVPWAIVFPAGGEQPRHPSQLYEAVLEGFILYFILLILISFTNIRYKTGLVTGVFLSGYGLARIIVEQYREPDIQLGFFIFQTTMGQWLSVPLLLLGLYLTYRSFFILDSKRKKH